MKKTQTQNTLGGYNCLNETSDSPNLKLKKAKQTHILLFFIICVLFVTGIFFAQNKENNSLLTKNSNDTYFAYYIDGVSSSTFPNQNTEYTLDVNKSNCTNGVIPSWDYATWSFVGDYSNYQLSSNTATRCNLYFVKNQTVSTVLGDLSVYPYTPDFTKSACDDATCESHEKGIYQMTTDAGTTYYYRGSVENNYLQFAGYWWRIIRINENGSIRIIYDGTTSHINGEASADRYYETTQFNPSNNSNEYVGYMYTLGESHGTGTSSIIKQANDKFYEEHLANYAEYIDPEAGFCGDRSTLNLQSGVGTGTVITYNKGYLRVVTSSPNLNCENTSDLYTTNSSNKGNKALTYPIGLITMDEVILAGHGGGVFDGNYNQQKRAPNTYLITGSAFWTMTPTGGFNPFGGSPWVAHAFTIGMAGLIDGTYTSSTYGLRPTINLKADMTITGEGTIESPYKVQ